MIWQVVAELASQLLRLEGEIAPGAGGGLERRADAVAAAARLRGGAPPSSGAPAAVCCSLSANGASLCNCRIKGRLAKAAAYSCMCVIPGQVQGSNKIGSKDNKVLPSSFCSCKD